MRLDSHDRAIKKQDHTIKQHASIKDTPNLLEFGNMTETHKTLVYLPVNQSSHDTTQLLFPGSQITHVMWLEQSDWLVRGLERSGWLVLIWWAQVCELGKHCQGLLYQGRCYVCEEWTLNKVRLDKWKTFRYILCDNLIRVNKRKTLRCNKFYTIKPKILRKKIIAKSNNCHLTYCEMK